MPKNSLDRLRYLVLLKSEETIKDLNVPTSETSPTIVELKEKSFNYCYLYENSSNPKGWRNDGYRSAWDCKSHWSFPMKGKLKRKIDKIVIDSTRELHRWATQLNFVQVPQCLSNPGLQESHTFVEYFVKSKGKQMPFSSKLSPSQELDFSLPPEKEDQETHSSTKASWFQMVNNKDSVTIPSSSSSSRTSKAAISSLSSLSSSLSSSTSSLSPSISPSPSVSSPSAFMSPSLSTTSSPSTSPRQNVDLLSILNHAAEREFASSPDQTLPSGDEDLEETAEDLNDHPGSAFHPFRLSPSPLSSPSPSPICSPSTSPSCSPSSTPSTSPIPPSFFVCSKPDGIVDYSLSYIHCHQQLLLLKKWARYLDSASEDVKEKIWTACRCNPFFINFDSSSFSKTIEQWSLDMKNNLATITIFFTTLGVLKSTNVLQELQGPLNATFLRDNNTSHKRTASSIDESDRFLKRPRVMDVASLVM